MKSSGAINVWLGTQKRNKTQINKNRRHYFAYLGIFVTEHSKKREKKEKKTEIIKTDDTTLPI